MNWKPKLKVLTPKWWDEEGKQFEGETDGVDTYCCCLYPAWFVYVPELDYDGYFREKDLEIVGEI